MLRGIQAHRRAMARWMAVVTGVLLVSGCASTLSARVTSFAKWPADAQGASYRIVPATGQTNNLEFQNIADMVRANIGPVGLVEASLAQRAPGRGSMCTYSIPIRRRRFGCSVTPTPI